MTIQRMDNVGIVVDDLAAATAFFVELGLKHRDGTAQAGGRECTPLDNRIHAHIGDEQIKLAAGTIV